MSTVKDHTDFQERKKLKQDVFLDGKFEDICQFVQQEQEKNGRQRLSECLSSMFQDMDKSKEDIETENDENLADNYLVMKDSEPYLKFAPQIFMY